MPHLPIRNGCGRLQYATRIIQYWKMKRIIFSDIDGTLLDSNHRMSGNTLKVIRKAEEEDIPFVIVSARSPSGIYPILRRYDFSSPIIAYSGGLILDAEGNTLHHRGMTKEAAKAIASFIFKENLDLSLSLFSFDDWLVIRKDERIANEERIVEAESREGTIDTIADDEISKILCICNPGETESIEEKLRDRFKDVTIVRSGNALIEIMAKGVSKAAAVKRLCSEYGVPLQEAIAFGDNYNDEEMLRAVGHGFLMGNAPEALKKRIRLHTDDNDHDGIYKALQSLGLI